jgi:hypothetical protein
MKKLTQGINSFFGSVNLQPFANEKFIYYDVINGILQRNLRKQGGREFSIDTYDFYQL